jgi:hypothetical protein
MMTCLAGGPTIVVSPQQTEEITMSDILRGASVPPPAARTRPLTPEQRDLVDQSSGAWVGWVTFAAIMMVMLGGFHAFQGLIALLRDNYYLVAKEDLTLSVDYTAWGWVHLIFGLVLIGVGLGVLAGQMWARVVGVVLAILSALVNAAFLAAYPIWSTIMIAFDVLVIWGLCVYGSALRTRRTDSV